MQEIDVLVRAAGATLLLTLASLLIRRAPRDSIVWLFLVFALGVCGFLARNTPEPDLALSGTAAVIAKFWSGNAAVFLWWFSLAVFDDDFRLDPIKLGVGGGWFITSILDRGILASGFAGMDLSWILVGMGVAMVGHIAYRLLQDRTGDLIEARRRARPLFAAVLAALLLVDLGVDLAFGLEWKPHWFTVTQNAAILLVAARTCFWLLSVDVRALAFQRTAADTVALVIEPVATSRPSETGTPDARLVRLNALMDAEQVYRDPDLTFEAFASLMGRPEAEVRRLVNRQLGHRHFRSFLNAYRVAEARRVLADPSSASRKMIAIAFDVGFASLASFNRAFKLAEGRSPSEYREMLAADKDLPAMPGSEEQLETGF